MSTTTERPPHGCFVDRSRKPSSASVRRVLSGAREAWDDLVDYLVEKYGLKSSMHFMYGPRSGWALRFERGGRLILAMYPNCDNLVVQIILSIPQVNAAIAMGLPRFISKVIEAAKKYPEGRWLFIPVKTVKNAQDLKPLIALKLARQK